MTNTRSLAPSISTKFEAACSAYKEGQDDLTASVFTNELITAVKHLKVLKGQKYVEKILRVQLGLAF